MCSIKIILILLAITVTKKLDRNILQHEGVLFHCLFSFKQSTMPTWWASFCLQPLLIGLKKYLIGMVECMRRSVKNAKKSVIVGSILYGVDRSWLCKKSEERRRERMTDVSNKRDGGQWRPSSMWGIINFAYLLLGIFKSNAETRGASLSLRLGRDLKGMSERPTAFLF